MVDLVDVLRATNDAMSTLYQKAYHDDIKNNPAWYEQKWPRTYPIGYDPDKYFHHYSCFVEGIYIMLGDSITEIELNGAKRFLGIFCRDFQKLYGMC